MFIIMLNNADINSDTAKGDWNCQGFFISFMGTGNYAMFIWTFKNDNFKVAEKSRES